MDIAKSPTDFPEQPHGDALMALLDDLAMQAGLIRAAAVDEGDARRAQAAAGLWLAARDTARSLLR